jgi:Na+/H+-dicarboxylate symporter
MYQFAINPFVIFASLALGAVLGLKLPAFSAQLAFVGDVYVDLLKMVVLPFMISAVIFSLQKLLRQGNTGIVLKRTCIVFSATLVVVAALGFTGQMLVQGSGPASAAQTEEYGRIVGSDASSSDTEIELHGPFVEKKTNFTEMLRASLVPTNIFAALSQGDALKALVFALLFGAAIGTVNAQLADGLGRGLETIYQASQRLTHWLNYPLPLILVCMTAGQLAKTGLEPMQTMLSFMLEFTAAAALVLGLAVVTIWQRSGQPLKMTLQSLRTPAALALATRSSATCMPAMIETLTEGLRFQRDRVELLVPLSISLLRIGPVLYATLFVAQLYGRTLTLDEFALIGVAAILAGCASAGMTGLVTVSLTSIVCGYMRLPFEAAFVLFLAVDPVCDMLRTLVLVVGNTAAVSLICDKPARTAR